MEGEDDVAALGTTGAPGQDLAATLQDIKKALAAVTAKLEENSERLSEMEGRVTGVAELQGPTLDRLEASVSKIVNKVAPGGTEAEAKEEEARSLLLKFPPTLRLEVVTEIANCDDTAAEQEWERLSWESRLRKVAEFVKTQWELKEKDASVRGGFARFSDVHPECYDVTKDEAALAIEILTTELGGEATYTSSGAIKPQNSRVGRRSSKIGQMSEREYKKVSTSAVLRKHAYMYSIYGDDAKYKDKMDGIQNSPADADLLPQQKWFWTDDDDRMCFNLLPTYHNLGDKAGLLQGVLEFVMFMLIIFSIVQLIRKSYRQDDDDTDFEVATDLIFTLLFSAEYAVRWSAVRPSIMIARPYTRRDFWVAKFKWMISFVPMIDLLSILPYFIHWVLRGYGIQSHASALAMLRLVRILKMGKYVHEQQTVLDLFKSLSKTCGDLMMFLLVLMVYVILSASVMFFLERNEDNENMFDSIPKSMWWAVMTVTTVGYGDATPVTDWGYVVASVTAIVGTLLMNIPLAFILNAFDEIYKKRKDKEKRAAAVAERIVQWQERSKERHLQAKLGVSTGDREAFHVMKSEEKMHPVTEILRSYCYDEKKKRVVVTRFGAKVKGKKRMTIHKEKMHRARTKRSLVKNVLAAGDTGAPILSDTVDQALPGALVRHENETNEKSQQNVPDPTVTIPSFVTTEV